MIKETIEAITDLKQVIETYKISGVQVQIGYLDSLKEKLVDGIELTTRQKITEYHKLFPPIGGLSDMHYWHDNFETRKQVNDQLNRLKLQLYNYLLHG